MPILNRVAHNDSLTAMNQPIRAQIKVPPLQQADGKYDVLIENISKDKFNGERKWNSVDGPKSKEVYRVDSTTQLSKNGYTVCPSTETLKRMQEEQERRRQQKLIEDEKKKELAAMPLWKIQEQQRQVRQREQLRYLYNKQQKKIHAHAQAIEQNEQRRAKIRNVRFAPNEYHEPERFTNARSQFIAPQRVSADRIQTGNAVPARDVRDDGFVVYTTLPRARDEVTTYGFGGSLPNPKSANREYAGVKQPSVDISYKKEKVSVVRFR